MSNTSEDPILDIQNLHVRFATPDGEVHAVRGIDLKVFAGESAAIVGESGSGKSQAMMGVMGLVAQNGLVTGSARYRGIEMIGMDQHHLNHIRGVKISIIFQEPMTSLDPLYSIGFQIAEPLIHHRRLDPRQARTRVLELLNLVGISDPSRRLGSYPHELSGGQRQRVMIAMALANDPDILIADEPTTALDVTIQAQILDLLADLRQRLGMAVVFITHDLGIVRRFSDRIHVMRAGEIVENGPTRIVAEAPRHPYTRMLLAAEPTGTKEPPRDNARVLLDAHNLAITFSLGGGLLAGAPHLIRAVDRVSIRLKQAQTIGIVGESGSGKSTLGRLLLRLLDGTGQIRFEGRDLIAMDKKALRPLRRELQIVFQDPYGSLSPRLTVGEIITEGLLVHEPSLTAVDRAHRAGEALSEVGLDPATRNRYPHEFSGGQRQRIAIARAIVLKPKIVVLDEPTSALDRSVQKQIIELLRRLQNAHDLSYIFISHDLAVVRAMADHILVMKDGKVIEEGDTEQIFDAPGHDYTKALMSAAFALTAFGRS